MSLNVPICYLVVRPSLVIEGFLGRVCGYRLWLGLGLKVGLWWV